MISKLTYFIVILIAVCACQKQKEVPSIVTDNVVVLVNQTVPSAVLKQNMKYNIILPSTYAAEPQKNYPVLYLLHGMGDDNNSWIDKGRAHTYVQHAIDSKAIPEIIVVMPDAMVTFYVNDYQSGLKYETYFEEEFLPYIESHYRINATKENRFITGLSMGGFGASYHAFKYPQKFAYCYSMSGVLEGAGSLTPSISTLIAACNGNYSGLPDYTIDCGTNDALVYTSNVNTHNALNQLNFTHEYIARAGSHDWSFWQQSLQTALERIGKYYDN
ncbi:MAG: esterase family protein [Prevotellaceae bacterium]|jgi:S-formylglutathione hydrolase FrmB|nr:esterase family protein [Prevotellaceae bacterium]